MSYDLIGGAQPVWLKAVMVREGDDVVTRCCVVTGGQFFPVEVRVNIPGLIAQARALGIDQASQATVGGFGSWLKKAVRKVTHNKIVKAVGSAVKKVANSPIAMIANPGLILAAHTTAKAATGKGLVKGKLGAVIDLGTKALSIAVPAAAAPSALQFVGPKAAAALGVGMRAINAAKAGGVIAAAAKMAQQKVDFGKVAARAVASKKVTAASVMPMMKQAVAIRAGVAKAAPALAKQVVQSAKVKTAFANIAQKAKLGHPDAVLASRVLQKSAQALGTIQQLEQKSSGGVPGLLVTAQGRIVKSPKGRFIQKVAPAAHPDILYRGTTAPQLKGNFTAVSGGWGAVGASPGWGGDTDPGNDIDGPFYDAVSPDDRVKLDDYSTVAGVRRKKPQPYKPTIDTLRRQLDDCGDAYDELWQDYVDATGVPAPRYDDPRVIDTSAVAGALTP